MTPRSAAPRTLAFESPANVLSGTAPASPTRAAARAAYILTCQTGCLMNRGRRTPARVGSSEASVTRACAARCQSPSSSSCPAILATRIAVATPAGQPSLRRSSARRAICGFTSSTASTSGSQPIARPCWPYAPKASRRTIGDSSASARAISASRPARSPGVCSANAASRRTCESLSSSATLMVAASAAPVTLSAANASRRIRASVSLLPDVPTAARKRTIVSTASGARSRCSRATVSRPSTAPSRTLGSAASVRRASANSTRRTI